MTTAATVLTATQPETSVPPERRGGRPRRFPPVLLWLAVFWLAVVVFLAVFADWLPFVHDPFVTNGAIARKSPQWFSEPILGGDQNGKDIFSYCVYGARASLLIGVATTVLGMLVGGLLGVTAGYFRGWWDSFVTAVTDVMLSFPALILLIGITSFWGRDTYKIVIGLTVLSVAPLARLVRASTLVYSQREFVMAAKAIGAKPSRVVFKEILPNVAPVALSFSFLAIALIIVAEGTLSFLGVGLEANIASWGTLITQGRNDLSRYPHVVMMPSLVLVLTVLSLNVIGERLRGRFDVRESAV
jgi:peptide/nickel transport system permease protein